MKQTATPFFTTRRLVIVAILGALTIALGLTPVGYIPVGPVKATILHIPVIIAAILEGPIIGALLGLIFGLSSIANALLFPTVVSYMFLNPVVSVIPRILIGVVAYYVYAGLKRLPKGVAIGLLSLVWALMAYYIGRGLLMSLGLLGSAPEGLVSIISYAVLLAAILVLAYITLVQFRGKPIELVASSALGTLTNTVFVLLAIYLFYAAEFVTKLGGDAARAGQAIVGVGVTQGIPETILAVVLTTAVVMAVQRKKA
jgi:uncharacterized membrane protein